MKRWFIVIGVGMILLLPACGGAVAPPAQPSVEVAGAAPIPTENNEPLPAPILPTATNIALPPTQAPAMMAKTEPTATPTATPIPEPTATFTPEPDWLAVTGRTGQNQIFLGNPDAPVTMIDYSDFM